MVDEKKLTVENLMDGVDRLMNDASFLFKAFDVTLMVGALCWLLSAYVLCWIFLSMPTRDHFFTILLAKMLCTFGGGSFNLGISFEHAGHILRESHSARVIAAANGAWNSAWPKVLFYVVISFPVFFLSARKFGLFAAQHGFNMGMHVHLRGAKIVKAAALDKLIKEAHQQEIIKRAIVLEQQRKDATHG